MKDKSVMTDGQLLSNYLDSGNEGYFEELIHRHSGMVLGVCRRMLTSDQQEAEDVFQAAFAMLAKHARKLKKTDWVGGWLYRVAYNGAVDTARRALRRRKHESRAGEMKMQNRTEDTGEKWEKLKPVLDQELNRLPEKLKAPLVLCYLQNKPQEEAAQILGWSYGQLRGCLKKAKKTMQSRLLKRGVTLPSAVLFGLIAENALSAAVPAALCTSTLKVSIGIASGGAAAAVAAANVCAIMKGMGTMLFWAKVKTAVLYLLVSMVVLLGVAGGAGIGRNPSPKVDGKRQLLPVCISEKWGFIDTQGKIVVEPVYEKAYAPSEGFACVKENGKYGFIHISLEKSREIKPQFDAAYPFKEGMALIREGGSASDRDITNRAPVDGGRYGYVNASGRVVIKPRFTGAGDFSEGMAWFFDSSGYTRADVEKRIAEVEKVIAETEAANENQSRKNSARTRSLWRLKEHLKALKKDGVKALPPQYGYINKKGKVVVKPVFMSAFSFSEGLAAVRDSKSGKYGYIDKTGEFAIQPEFSGYRCVSSFTNSVALVRIKDNFALINKKREVLLELDGFDDIGRLSEGLIPVARKQKGKQRSGQDYIDTKGTIAVAGECYEGREFHNGLAVVKEDNSNGKYGYIDRTGKIVIPCQYSAASDFKNGYAAVEFYKYGFMNTGGDLVIPPVYDSVSQFSEGLAVVKKNGKLGFIDTGGKVIIQPGFTEVGEGFGDEQRMYGMVYNGFSFISSSPFSEGLAAVRKGDLWGYINKKGDMVIPPRFVDVMPFSDGRAAVRRDYRSDIEYIDPRGNVISKGKLIPHYSMRIPYNEGYVFGNTSYRKNSKSVIMDAQGTITGELPKGLYFAGSKISSGLCAVHKPDKLPDFRSRAPVAPPEIKIKAGYANVKGEIVIDLQFDEARDFSEGLAAVQKDGLYGFINEKGTMVIKPRFKGVGDFSGGLAWFSDGRVGSSRVVTFGAMRVSTGFSKPDKDARYGYIDKTGKVVIKLGYQSAMDFSEGYAAVMENDEWFFIDRSGRTAIRFPEGLTFPGGHLKSAPSPSRASYPVRNGLIPVEMKSIAYLNTGGEYIWCSSNQRPATEVKTETDMSRFRIQTADGSTKSPKSENTVQNTKPTQEELLEIRKTKLRVLYDGCKMYALNNDGKYPAKISALYPDYVNDLSAFTVSGEKPHADKLESKCEYYINTRVSKYSHGETVFIREKTAAPDGSRFYITLQGVIRGQKK